MKQVLTSIVLLCVWAVLSLTLASQWMAHPDLFPQLPASLWQWVDSWYQAGNAEQVVDMEFIVVITISAAAVLIGMLGVAAMSKQRRPLNKGS